MGEAEHHMRECLRLFQETLGDSHPSTLISTNELGQFLMTTGLLDEAELLFRAIHLYSSAFQLNEEAGTLGAEHAESVARTVNLAGVNLASLLSDRKRPGDMDEAESLYRESQRYLRETRGGTAPETLNVEGNLANLLWNQGKVAEAEPLMQECLRMKRETLGENHPETLASQSCLATLLQKTGRVAEAIQLFEDELRRQLLRGDQEGRLADALDRANDLRSLLVERGDTEQAEAVLDLCLKHRLFVLTELNLASEWILITCAGEKLYGRIQDNKLGAITAAAAYGAAEEGYRGQEECNAERFNNLLQKCVENQPTVTLTADGQELACRYGFGPRGTPVPPHSGAPICHQPPPAADDADAELRRFSTTKSAALADRLAVAHKGHRTFAQMADHARESAAAGLVVVNDDDQVFSPQYTPAFAGEGDGIHVVGVSAADGARLLAASEATLAIVFPECAAVLS
jgi:tetratricopeptide (TPR) repeat protein